MRDCCERGGREGGLRTVVQIGLSFFLCCCFVVFFFYRLNHHQTGELLLLVFDEAFSSRFGSVMCALCALGLRHHQGV